MKGGISRIILFPVLFCLVIYSCAKVSSPAGGPKDKEPPVIVKSVPEPGTLNFRGKQLIVTFNEYVILDKINEKFMVSPPLKSKPRILIRGKSIRIEYDEDLRDSTTYTFYFQDAIRDLNENNQINNYQFVFSTGNVIDSLSVTGNVYTALNLNPPENTLVLLYSQMEDTAVIKQLPDYITRVEANGEFRIDNVKPGIYRLFALKDADNSKNYNLRDEEFAFLPDTVKITPEKNFLPVKKDTIVQVKPVGGKVPLKPAKTGEYKLVMFAAEKKAYYLTSSSRKVAYQFVYTLSLPPDSMTFEFSTPDAGADAYFIENSKNRDTMKVWLTDSTLYAKPQIEAYITFPFTDTLGITSPRKDTILMRFLAPRSPRARVAKPSSYRVSNGIAAGMIRPDRHIVLSAETPFQEPDTSKLGLYEVTKESRIKLPFDLLKDSLNACRYHLKADFVQEKNYLFIADSAAFRSIYGEVSDSTGTKFTVMTPEAFGSLTLDIKNHTGGRIIQLLDNSEKVVREVYMENDGKLEFPLLEKGFYRVRAIFDINGDRKWTTGDYDTHRQPEPVSYYPSELEIKVNWQINQPWDLKLKNYKDQKFFEEKRTTTR